MKNPLYYVSHIFRSLQTGLRKRLGGSDLSRWRRIENLSESWDSRIHAMARHIEDGLRVIEFGAGRQVLRGLLATCEYTPSDIVSRGPDTLICDLNNDPLPELNYDLAFFSGVLEYVNDVPSLANQLSLEVGQVVASYAILETNPSRRRSKGWVNDYNMIEFQDIFESVGYTCVHTGSWNSQMIFHFKLVG